MTKKEFLEISKKILIRADESVISQLEAEYDFINSNLEHIRKIDVSNVEPLARISPKINWFREDIVNDKLSKKVILENAANSDENYVIIKRTIK